LPIEDKGKSKEWIERALGWTVEVVQHPPKMAPQEVMKARVREWAKEGVAIDWEKLLPPQGLKVLPRRWVVERTFAWLGRPALKGTRFSRKLSYRF
jgi:putative transposase